jgi:hypothetical protein
MKKLQAPNPFFLDASGDALDAGYVFVGTAGANAETNQLTVYWDEAGTQPAAQPLRTANGYIVNGVTRARVFVNADDFSVLVKNRHGVVIDTVLSGDESQISSAMSDVVGASTKDAARVLLGAAKAGANSDITSLSALSSVPTVVSSLVASAVAAFPRQNRLINPAFTINQRNTVAGTISAGSFFRDRWKAGASGCTVSITGSVLTIASGSVVQVVEGDMWSPTSTYVMTWTGTATARFNGGSYVASPLVISGVTAGANLTIEFSTGTLSFPMLVDGSTAVAYQARDKTTEEMLCFRYFWAPALSYYVQGYGAAAGQTMYDKIIFPVPMRAAPSISAAWVSGENASAGAFTALGRFGALSSITSDSGAGFRAIVNWNSFSIEL